MNLQETLDLVADIDISGYVPEEVYLSIMQLKEDEPNREFAAHFVGCSFCGEESVLIHTIPAKFPGECPNCGREKSCYIISEF